MRIDKYSYYLNIVKAVAVIACVDESIDPTPRNYCNRMIKNAGIIKVVSEGGT